MAKRGQEPKSEKMRGLDEPNMSDNTLLMKVEDLIFLAMGPDTKNVINFKVLEIVLKILARQLRVLEQVVEVETASVFPERRKANKRVNTARAAVDQRSESEAELSAKKGKGGERDADSGAAAPGDDKLTSSQKRKTAMGISQKGNVIDGKDQFTASPEDKDYVKHGLMKQDSSDTPARRERTRVGSIEVVTQSQFNLLEEKVKTLGENLAPMGPLVMPDNKELRQKLASGQASLSDVMEAMQVNARVKAAEQGIARMAGLLTQLAATGALPKELADQLNQFQIELQDIGLTEETIKDRPKSKDQRQSSGIRSESITREEAEQLVEALRLEMVKAMEQMSSKAASGVEDASLATKQIGEKLGVASKLDSRISTLHSLVSDYASQLSGFDAGVTIQIQGFQEQMAQIRNELKSGLVMLEGASGNTEALAIMELTDNCEKLVLDMEQMGNTHQRLEAAQNKLIDELRNFLDNMDILRDQKADRDEVIDGLRNKADITRLKGLLTDKRYNQERAEINKRIELCHEKFRKQDQTWMIVLEDINKTLATKAGKTDLISTRDDIQKSLQELQDALCAAEQRLGDPKAALFLRQLSRDGVCATCGAAALMDTETATPIKPHALPSLHPEPSPGLPSITICAGPTPALPPDVHRHLCQRWCGGSHTLVTNATSRRQAEPLPSHNVPTRRYEGYGPDGRLYMFEEEIVPCAECNVLYPIKDEAEPNTATNGAADGRAETTGDQDIRVDTKVADV